METMEATQTLPIPTSFRRQRKILSRLRIYRDPMFDLVRDLGIDVRVAVEIGSEFGWWAFRFLSHIPEATLYCVDPWPKPPRKRREALWHRHKTGDDNFREWSLCVVFSKT